MELLKISSVFVGDRSAGTTLFLCMALGTEGTADQRSRSKDVLGQVVAVSLFRIVFSYMRLNYERGRRPDDVAGTVIVCTVDRSFSSLIVVETNTDLVGGVVDVVNANRGDRA